MVNKIAIIAGNGSLPNMLIDELLVKKIPFFVAGIRGDFDLEKIVERVGVDNCALYNLSQLSKMLQRFRKEKVREIVFIGGTSRPKFSTIKINFLNLSILCGLLFSKKKGDNALFVIIKNKLEKYGFKIVPIHKFMPRLLAEKKCYTSVKPTDEDLKNIKIGVEAAKKLGEADLGQAVIMNNSSVLLFEDRSGTANLIARAGEIFTLKAHKTKHRAILVKTKKAHQLDEIDIPTIGIQTVKQCFKAGISGIVIEAGASYIVDVKNIIAEADKRKMFVVGI